MILKTKLDPSKSSEPIMEDAPWAIGSPLLRRKASTMSTMLALIIVALFQIAILRWPVWPRTWKPVWNSVYMATQRKSNSACLRPLRAKSLMKRLRTCRTMFRLTWRSNVLVKQVPREALACGSSLWRTAMKAFGRKLTTLSADTEVYTTSRLNAPGTPAQMATARFARVTGKHEQELKAQWEQPKQRKQTENKQKTNRMKIPKLLWSSQAY